MHTHRLPSEEGVLSVYNLLLHETSAFPEVPFSAGLHPWYAGELSTKTLSRSLDQCAKSQDMIAFGETGLDKACNIPMQLQQDIFELHLRKAVELRKPLVIHCVKAWEELIEISAGYPIRMILHGYNGSAQLTDHLLQKGFLFSVGKAILDPRSKIHQSIRRIPPTAILCETDNSNVSIQDIYAGLCASLDIEEAELKETIFNTFARLISHYAKV